MAEAPLIVLTPASFRNLPIEQRRKARVQALREQKGRHSCPTLERLVLLGANGVEKLKAAREDRATSDALADIGSLLKSAVLAYAYPDEKGDPLIVQVLRLVALVRSDETEYAVRLTLKQYSQPDGQTRLYGIELLKMGWDPAVRQEDGLQSLPK